MTALLLDLGNTRWKMARAVGGEIGDVCSGPYGEMSGLAAAARDEPTGITQLLLASVVDPQTTDGIVACLQDVTGLPVKRIASTDRMPNMVSGYQRPEQLGVDRLLAMVAARARDTRPLCVVDAGTAITVDFLDGEGQHLGGFILPGIRMSRDSLLAGTSIPRDEAVDEHAILGRDTPTAVALGAQYAVAGLVERFVSGSAALFPGRVVHTFVGGGDAQRFLGLLPQPCSTLDHLVLRGLAVVAASGDP